MKIPDASQIEAELTPFDGRLYDLSEDGGVLSLQLRRGVAWERALIIALIAVLWWMLMTATGWAEWRSSPHNFKFVLYLGHHLAMATMVYGGCYATFITRQSWKFDKIGGKMTSGRVRIASLSSVYAVKGWRRGTKFYIALKSRTDKPRQLGSLGFCRSERAWRDDAAQIAAFLGVPLEIPPNGE